MSQLDSLQSLISSLSKSEKRHFKLYSQRVGRSAEKHFIQLYDAIEKQPVDSDEQLIKRIKDSSVKKHLPFYKNLLFEMIMEGLLDMYRAEGIRNSIRRIVLQGEMLFNRGMFKEALRSEHKAEAIAREYECWEELLLALRLKISIMNVSKDQFESTHEVIIEQKNVLDIMQTENQMRALLINLWLIIRKHGRTATQEKQYDEIRNNPLLTQTEGLSFFGSYCQISLRGLYAYVVETDNNQAEHYDLSLVRLMEDNPRFIKVYPMQYIRAMMNAILTALSMNKEEIVEKLFTQFNSVTESETVFSTIFLKYEVRRIRLNLELSIYWYKQDFDAITGLRDAIEEIYSSGVQPVDDLQRQYAYIELSLAYMMKNNHQQALRLVIKVLNEKSSSNYLETYVDALLMKWVLCFPERDLELLQSIYRALSYVIKKHGIQDPETLLLIDVFKVLQQRRLDNASLKQELERINSVISVNRLSRKYLVSIKLSEMCRAIMASNESNSIRPNTAKKTG